MFHHIGGSTCFDEMGETGRVDLRLQSMAQVIRIEHGMFAHLGELLPVAPVEGPASHDSASIPVPLLNVADGQWGFLPLVPPWTRDTDRSDSER